MQKTTNDTGSQLELEAFRALSGAEYVRLRILHGLSMGTPSIEDDVYLVKSRIKKVDSLVKKVLERQDKGKKRYRPSSARDIVGLRLLTLFRNDLPILVGRFLSFVVWSQRPPFSLFYGSKIQEAIEEIKIYPTSDVNDAMPRLVASEFEAFGFRRGKKKRIGAAAIEVETKPTSYSSIHVVLWANGPSQTLADRVPVEAQLRTSLEDVWGEIDHRMRYKTRAADLALGAPPPHVQRTLEKELIILKKHLDLAADQADLLGYHVKSDINSSNGIRSYSKLISYDIENIIDEKFDTSIRLNLHETVDKLHDIYRSLYDYGGNDINSLKGIRVSLQGCADEIAAYLASPKFRLGQGWQGTEGYYRLKMEIALCYYWQGVISRALSSVEAGTHHEEEMIRAVNRALVNYIDVSEVSANSGDAVLYFRIGNALSLLGEHSFALLKFEKAYKGLESDPRVPPRHHFRVRIPRSYALALWETAERGKVGSIAQVGESLLESERRQLYLSALVVTLEIADLDPDWGDLDRSTVSPEEERRVTVNNIIEYALCFLKAGGDPKELRSRKLTPDRLHEYLGELVGSSVDSIPTVNLADTARELARWRGDRTLATRAAKRVKTLLRGRNLAVALPDFSYREMDLDAGRELEVGLKPFPGYPRIW